MARYRRNPANAQRANYTTMPWMRSCPAACEAYAFSGDVANPGWPKEWLVPLSMDDGKVYVGSIAGRVQLTAGDFLVAITSLQLKFMVAPKAEFTIAYREVVPPVVAGNP